MFFDRRLESAERKTRCQRFGGVAAIVGVLFGMAPAARAATPAGTVISNTARIAYNIGGTTNTTSSNRVDIVMGEIVDLSVTSAPTCGTPPAGQTAVAFRVTNLGNGNQAFIADAPTVSGGSDFVPTGVYVDSNGNGCYDPGIDQLIPPGGALPPLAPGQSIIIFILGTGGNGQGGVSIVIRPVKGTGGTGTTTPPGTPVYRTPGDGGTSSPVTPIPATPTTPLSATLVKSQSVRAPDGSAEPRHNAIITYTIQGSFSGSGTASDVVIADSIPAGTEYVAGSLTVDGAAVSDGTDGDKGNFDGSKVSAVLGDVAAPSTHIVSFQVRIE